MKTFTKISTAVFLLMALLHAARLAYGWEAVFNGMAVPMWASGIGLVVAFGLAWGLWKESK